MNGRVESKPVMDGHRIKWTLEQARSDDPGLVRLDWLRFTLPLDAVVRDAADVLGDLTADDLIDKRTRDLTREIRGLEVEYSAGPAVAREGARILVELLGDGFACGTVEARGMDYYSSRAMVLHDGAEVAQVLAGSKGAAQASTVHFNLHGACMLHLGADVYKRLHDWIGRSKGWITRVDLALDVFTGASVLDCEAAYLDGQFDVRGKRPGQRNHGSWTLGHSRTFEVGNRETGKLMRCYEKGDELFGDEADDPWLRYEVEIRNNNRIIDLAVLTRPGDFFAGAYPFCESVLSSERVAFVAQVIPTKPKLQEVTEEATAARVLRWFARTAAPTAAALLSYAGDAFDQIVIDQSWRFPARLRGISPANLRAAFEKVAAGLTPPAAPSIQGA